MAGKYDLRRRPALHKPSLGMEDHRSDTNGNSPQPESPEETSPGQRHVRVPRPKSARAGQRTPPAPGWKYEARELPPDFSDDEEPPVQRTPSGNVACNDGSGLSPSLAGGLTRPPSPRPTPEQLRRPTVEPPHYRAESADVGASPKADQAFLSPHVLLVLVCAVAVTVCWSLVWLWGGAALPPSVSFTGQPPMQASVSRWRDEVATLSGRFPYQRQWLWKVLRATVSRMLLEARQPAVVLLLASEAQRDDMQCVMRAAADAVLNATQSPARPLLVDGAALGALDEDEAKGRLNTELDRLRGGSDVVVFMMEDLQELQPLTAMLLHGFCDNDNAPRKQALFLLSVVTDRTPPADKDVVVAAEHALWKAWGHVLREDIFHALIGRIAGNVAAVTDEGSELLCRKHHL